jgi:hypothetical protein
MRRKRISRTLPRWLRVAAATATWAVTVSLVEASAESDIGRTARQLEERIELQLQLMEPGRIPAGQPDPPPERSHDESIEPWELVGV